MRDEESSATTWVCGYDTLSVDDVRCLCVKSYRTD